MIAALFCKQPRTRLSEYMSIGVTPRIDEQSSCIFHQFTFPGWKNIESSLSRKRTSRAIPDLNDQQTIAQGLHSYVGVDHFVMIKLLHQSDFLGDAPEPLVPWESDLLRSAWARSTLLSLLRACCLNKRLFLEFQGERNPRKKKMNPASVTNDVSAAGGCATQIPKLIEEYALADSQMAVTVFNSIHRKNKQTIFVSQLHKL